MAEFSAPQDLFMGSLKWPELYGFTIYGNGPTFVIYVEPKSIAEKAGIKIGDKIIELDNQDVSLKNADIIKNMANNSKKSPPSISVQTFCKEVELISNSNFFGKKIDMNGFGLKISGNMPVLVEQCIQNSPSYLAGIRSGDIICEVNSKALIYAEILRPMLTSTNKLLIKYIPLFRESSIENDIQNENKKSGMTSSSPRLDIPNLIESDSNKNLKIPQYDYSLNTQNFNEIPNEKLRRAQNFYAALNTTFNNEPNKRKYVINELKLFTETDNVKQLVENLNSILNTSNERLLFTEIKKFIPIHHQSLFESLTNKIYQSEQFLSKNFTSNTGQNLTDFKEVPKGIRRLVLKRDKNDKFGLTLQGAMPVVIENVDFNSPAYLCGLQPNDVILSINGMDVVEKNHKFLVELIQSSGSNPIFEVIQKSEFDLSNKYKSTPFLSNNSGVLDLENFEGKTFNEKVKEVLSSKEKQQLKRTLLDYNSTNGTELLNTPAKKSLWFFLLPTLEENHQEYVKNYLNSNNSHDNSIDEDYSTNSISGSSNLKSNLKSTTNKYSHNNNKSISFTFTKNKKRCHDKKDLNDVNFESKDLKSSKQYVSAPSLIDQPLTRSNFLDENELYAKLSRQLDYLLNINEKNVVKEAFEVYYKERNVFNFLEKVENIFDTHAKRTLWFHIIPLLDENDQEYSKRKLANLISSDCSKGQYAKKRISKLNSTDQTHNSNPNLNYFNEYNEIDLFPLSIKSNTSKYNYLSNYEIEKLYDMTPDYEPNLDNRYKNSQFNSVQNSHRINIETSDFIRPVQSPHLSKNNLTQNFNNKCPLPKMRHEFIDKPKLYCDSRFNSFSNLNNQIQNERHLQNIPSNNKSNVDFNKHYQYQHHKTPEVWHKISKSSADKKSNRNPTLPASQSSNTQTYSIDNGKKSNKPLFTISNIADDTKFQNKLDKESLLTPRFDKNFKKKSDLVKTRNDSSKNLIQSQLNKNFYLQSSQKVSYLVGLFDGDKENSLKRPIQYEGLSKSSSLLSLSFSTISPISSSSSSNIDLPMIDSNKLADNQAEYVEFCQMILVPSSPKFVPS